MDPSQYFTAGSKGFILTKQALDTISKAENAGLSDKANQLKADLEVSIKEAQRGGWKNVSGFGAQLEVIDGLNNEINAIRSGQSKVQEQSFSKQEKTQDELKNVASSINVLSKDLNDKGVIIPQSNVDSINNAVKMNDVETLKAESKLLESRRAERISEMSKLKAAESQKLTGEMAMLNMKKQRTIKVIDKYIDSNGNAKPALNSSVGFGEGFGRSLGKITEGNVIGTSQKVMSQQDELIRDVRTDDVLNTVQLLKPASDTDVNTITETRPSITDSPGQWATYLNSMKNSLSQEVDMSKLSGTTSQSQVEIPRQIFIGGEQQQQDQQGSSGQSTPQQQVQAQSPSQTSGSLSDSDLQIRNAAIQLRENSRRAREEVERNKTTQSRQLPPPEGFK